MDNPCIQNIITQFKIYGDLISYKRLGSGHINSTYVSTFNQGGSFVRYTHQKINKKVFKNPSQVMDNIVRVTEHIQKKLKAQGISDVSNRVLTVVKTQDNLPYFIDTNGDYWRTYFFIEHVKTYDFLHDKKIAFTLGEAVGVFQQQLVDYNGPELTETIPQFHNMQTRYKQLFSALSNDSFNRAKNAKEEISFLLHNEERGMILIDSLNNGLLKEGITHNDTKINNLLFSEKDNSVLCVIDLDTVMPGTILFDTGDLIRTATITGSEDEQNLSTIHFNFDLFKSLIEGYLSVGNSFLSAYEKTLLAESGRNITQIMAVRFLTDYLNGDTYYKTSRKNHNLDRARTQIAFIKSLDSQWDKVQKFFNA